MTLTSTNSTLVAATEESEIDRNVLAWLNEYPDKPVAIVRYEPELAADTTGMVLSTIQGTRILEMDILGNHKAEYQFKIMYRVKPGTSIDERLKADELLNAMGEWAILNPPDLGDSISDVEVEATTRAAYFGSWENGDEDHQILMRLTYSLTV